MLINEEGEEEIKVNICKCGEKYEGVFRDEYTILFWCANCGSLAICTDKIEYRYINPRRSENTVGW